MRIPISIAQIPTLAKQMAQREYYLATQKQRASTFRLCYFSARTYFPYLFCAVQSLLWLPPGLKLEVLVFSDNDLPLSDEQIATLQALPLSIRVIPWPKSVGWGAEQIGWIWRAYALACEGLGDDDYIARIDSDVFFFNDRIFRATASSPADLIGDGHYVGFEYCQGGAYFMRVAAARRVNQFLAESNLEKVLSEANIRVEDRAATHFFRLLNLKVWMTCYMMFPHELQNAGGLTSWSRFKFSCLHFTSKSKDGMLGAYIQGVLPADQTEEFAKATAIP